MDEVIINPPNFPEGWNNLTHEDKRKMLLVEKEIELPAEIRFLDTTEDDSVVDRKLNAAKASFFKVMNEMQDEIEKAKAEEDLYYESEDSYSLNVGGNGLSIDILEWHYTNDTMNSWLSSVRYNYNFDSGFAAAKDFSKEISNSTNCPCSVTQKQWRTLFQVDFMLKCDTCKTKKSNRYMPPSSLIDHLETEAEKKCYLHKATLYYLRHLYNIPPRSKKVKSKKRKSTYQKDPNYKSPYELEREKYRDARSRSTHFTPRMTFKTCTSSTTTSQSSVTKQSSSNTTPKTSSQSSVTKQSSSNTTPKVTEKKNTSSTTTSQTTVSKPTSSTTTLQPIVKKQKMVPVQRMNHGREVVRVTTTDKNAFVIENGIKIIFRPNIKLNQGTSYKRNKRKRQNILSKSLEKRDFVSSGINKETYAGTKINIYCTATDLIRTGTVHCLGKATKSSVYSWKVFLVYPKADLLLTNEQLVDIASRNNVSKPYRKLWIGEVIFSDIEDEEVKVKSPSDDK